MFERPVSAAADWAAWILPKIIPKDTSQQS